MSRIDSCDLQETMKKMNIRPFRRDERTDLADRAKRQTRDEGRVKAKIPTVSKVGNTIIKINKMENPSNGPAAKLPTLL